MKIIGNTVGMGLPKPNLMQTDPNKGDFIKGKEEFLKDPNLVGDKGDPFTYEDFTPEQLAALKGEPGKTPVKGTDYFTPTEVQEIAEQAAGMVEIPEGSDIELDTSLTASGKAADAKAVGDALNGKLDKSGGTLTGNLTLKGSIVIPVDGSSGIRDAHDVPILRYDNVEGELRFRLGQTGARLTMFSSERPLYNGNEIALKKEIPDVSGIAAYPGDDHINGLINTALGVIENGTY